MLLRKTSFVVIPQATKMTTRHFPMQRRSKEETLQPYITGVKVNGLTKENETFLSKHAYRGSTTVDKTKLEAKPFTCGLNVIRTGIIGFTIGKQFMWTKKGTEHLVTLVQLFENEVIDYLSPEALQVEDHQHYSTYAPGLAQQVVGSVSYNPVFTQLSKMQYPIDHFIENGLTPKLFIGRFYITPDMQLPLGTALDVNHFRVGDKVSVEAKSIDHGLQGVMKRWGMKGGRPDELGATKSHRRVGTINSGESLGNVPKGKRMPGWMGYYWKRVHDVQIVRINYDENILYLDCGALPGEYGSMMKLCDSIKYATRTSWTQDNHPPIPTAIPTQDEPLLTKGDVIHKDFHNFSDPSVEFEVVQTKVKRSGRGKAGKR